MKDLKVIFMGTPIFAVEILKALVSNTHVLAVVTQPDKEVGRKRILTPSPVKEFATEHNIDVLSPNKIREDYKGVLSYEPDIIITCAYGQIIPKEILEYPRLGCINVHASLLPKYRGGAPIQRAIMDGMDKTGITVMYMDEHMDSGDIIAKEEVSIDLEDNILTLSDKLMKIGAKLLIETLPSIIDGTNDRIKQDESEVSFAPIIKREDEIIDFNKPSKEIYDKVRALYDQPCAYFYLKDKAIKVYSIEIGEKVSKSPSVIENIYKDGIGIGTLDKEIILKEIKPEGKNRIAVRDYLNGINIESLKGVKVNVREN